MTVAVLTGEELLMNFILFVAGFLVGLGVSKLLKGLLLVIAGLAILIIAGFTVAGILNPAEIWEWFGPLKNAFTFIASLLARYPALSLGLIIGVVIGAIK